MTERKTHWWMKWIRRLHLLFARLKRIDRVVASIGGLRPVWQASRTYAGYRSHISECRPNLDLTFAARTLHHNPRRSASVGEVILSVER